ncbi:MAG: DNA recombination protein RmuC [Bacteroidales bacterium]|nr:DNA recombination protein RmuC [Bacteroidales bacterium]
MTQTISIIVIGICILVIAGLSAALLYQISMRKAEKKMYEENIDRTLVSQLDVIKSTITAENTKLQKQSEESLKKEAVESFRSITGALDEDIKRMKESFEAQKKEHTESTASIKSQFEATAKSLIQQTNEVTKGAENLAAALRGRNKMQGCMGETLLENIFLQEGMVEGRDFDREYTLRDANGNILHNEDLGTRMRPDFILHFPDDTDVIVDSKVSLSALSDYYSAETQQDRDAAAKRNYDSVVSHIKELTAKEYQKYNEKSGRKTLGYVMMFIPNYGALQLAKQIQPNIFTEAFRQNVLITTEETVMPFLRIIRTAWINQEQIANQQKIIDEAKVMIERVSTFLGEHAEMGKKLSDALECYNRNTVRLQANGKTILHSANELVKLGVPKPKKDLPQMMD